MRRRGMLAVAAAVLVVAGIGLAVHGASAPAVTSQGAGAWLPISTAPLSPREGAVVAQVGNALVVFGGRRFQPCPDNARCPFPGYRNDGAVYDAASRTWTPMATAPRDASSGPWAVDGSTLVLLTDGTTQRVVAYHLDTNSWSVLPPPPVPLLANTVVAAGGGFAYVADDAGSGPLRRVERVDLTSGRWDLLPRSDRQPRMFLQALFVGPTGPIMAGLNPYRSDSRVQVEALQRNHWHRFPTPDLHAAFYDFAWTGARLVTAFPPGGGAGQSLDPTTSRWTAMPVQPGYADGSGWWAESFAALGPHILKRGDLFDTVTGRTLRLARPPGSGPGVSAGLTQRRVYVMDSASRVWWQPT